MQQIKIKEITLGDKFEDERVEQLTKESHQLLGLLIEIYGQKGLAQRLSKLGVDGLEREILNKWCKKPDINPILIDEKTKIKIRSALLPTRPEHYDNPDFKFIDLFAGIGGIRKGFDEIGGKCVFTNEWDAYARRTYLANHYVSDSELPYFLNSPEQDKGKNTGFMDLQQITLSQNEFATEKEVEDSINYHIEDHDVLLAGFPCQPFSLAGISKKNSLGRAHGFECETQGTLFFDVERVLKVKQPKFFVLENVKNLKGHDQGNTFAVIIRTLDKLGYFVTDITDENTDIDDAIKSVRKRKPEPTIIDGQLFTPQHRERIVLVGVRKDINAQGLTLKNITQHVPENGLNLTDIIDKVVDPKYTLTENLWGYLFKYALKHQAKGNGFGFGLVDPNDPTVVTRTLSARYHKDGSEILLNYQGIPLEYLAEAKLDPIEKFDASYRTPRRLTPQECARLMGFEIPVSHRISADSDFIIPVSDTRAYRQFGNSVVVPVFKSVAKLMEQHIKSAVVSKKQENAA
jgi:DNA (cytosine-5)-methyltransferase 1